jgi:hypothetical protein
MIDEGLDSSQRGIGSIGSPLWLSLSQHVRNASWSGSCAGPWAGFWVGPLGVEEA